MMDAAPPERQREGKVETASSGTTTPQPSVRQSPAWRAPAIAVAIAAGLLAVLFVPGVLVRWPPMDAAGVDAGTRAAMADANRTLEDEIARLQAQTRGGVCMFDGQLYPRSVEQLPPGTLPPADRRLEILPPAPDRVPAPSAPGAAGNAAAGSIDDVLRAATVLVLNSSEGGTGSGFFIAPDLIVTNAHVVGDAESGVLITNELIGKPVPVAIVARTPPGDPPGPDFALLRLETAVPSARPLTVAPVRRTQQVYASGFPGFQVGDQVEAYVQSIIDGREARPPAGVVTAGIITTIQDTDTVQVLPHTASISPGNSGGPLVDLCGNVVGINTFIRQSTEDDVILHGDYALSAADVERFLASNAVTITPAATPCVGPAPAAPAPAPRAASGAN